MRNYYIFIIVLIIFYFVILGICLLIINDPIRKSLSFDQSRIYNLFSLHNKIDTYYIHNNILPESLDYLNLFGNDLNDPETKKPYEYKLVSKLKYQLCATFSNDFDYIFNNSSWFERDMSAIESNGINNISFKKGYNCFTYKVEISSDNGNNLNAGSPSALLYPSIGNIYKISSSPAQLISSPSSIQP